MATFKVGQRVRVVKDIDFGPPYRFTRWAGTETVIVSIFVDEYDGLTMYESALDCDENGGWSFTAEELAPLTDGELDQWAIDAVRKVTKPQHIEPVAPVSPREIAVRDLEWDRVTLRKSH